jgi:hypothetical protein
MLDEEDDMIYLSANAKQAGGVTVLGLSHLT